MPDHTPGLQHSSVVFYLNPDSGQGSHFCDDCNRFACVKMINIREGSITLENFFCQMCYLSRLILLSTNMYGFISTECGKALWMSGGLPVDDVEDKDINLGHYTGFPCGSQEVHKSVHRPEVSKFARLKALLRL